MFEHAIIHLLVNHGVVVNVYINNAHRLPLVACALSDSSPVFTLFIRDAVLSIGGPLGIEYGELELADPNFEKNLRKALNTLAAPSSLTVNHKHMLEEHQRNDFNKMRRDMAVSKWCGRTSDT